MASKIQLNITIPVFNRLQATQKTLIALHKAKKFTPPAISITVVDNGSDHQLVKSLIEFKTAGIIDKLFLLPKNMGISCACNIGWDMTDAPYYMKLDNDFVLHDPQGISKIFSYLEHLPWNATRGPGSYPTGEQEKPATVNTPAGPLWICPINLPGAAIIIPRRVSGLLGQWSEDYGLYGAEDGDYGMRMRAAGFPQYFYEFASFFNNIGGEDPKNFYSNLGLNKPREHGRLFIQPDGTLGFFALNHYLFEMCIRNWKVPRRYTVLDVDSHHRVQLAERPEYLAFQKVLEECRRLVALQHHKKGKSGVLEESFIQDLKKRILACGQGCH